MSSQVSTKPESSEKTELKKPRQYAVYIYNDDYTPINFVVEILVQIFKKTPNEAYDIAMQIHNSQRGLAGIYSYDIAETKMTQVINAAKNNEYPLECKMEPV